MKNIGLVCWLLVSICCGLQAKKTVKLPYFMACNTRSIEIAQVTLGKKSTRVEVMIYGMPGAKVWVDSTAVLCVGELEYALQGSSKEQCGAWMAFPASGELAATLEFAPLPEDTESFDFIEMPAESSGWRIFGVRLDGGKPQVEMPEGCSIGENKESLPLPQPELKLGTAIVKGKILGYRPEYDVKLSFREPSWFFTNPFGEVLKIAPDGTFRLEQDVLMPGCAATLRLNRSNIELFLVPGGELEVTINLPAVFWSESRLLGKKKEVEAMTPVCFKGDYAGLNTELLRAGKKMRITGGDFYSDICGMTPLAFKQYLFKRYETAKREFAEEMEWSETCRIYMQANMEMNFLTTLCGYKNSLAYAPMLAGRKEVKLADMTVDSTSFFKEILELDILRSPYQRYYRFYPDFVKYSTGMFRNVLPQDPLWEDVLLGKRVSRNLNKRQPLSETEHSILSNISSSEIKELLLRRNAQVEADLKMAEETMKKKSGCTVLEVGKEVAANYLLQLITRPYRGKMVLIDMWNTWCGPCMRAMKSIKSLKEELKEVVYLYIADETSPEVDWKRIIPDIPGIHYRITNEQSAALGKFYEYSGIPTYFVVDREGKVSYKATGFPGVQKLKEELTK